MANIIYDEKRAVRIGEVCAINSKYINPVILEPYDDGMVDEMETVEFFTDSRLCVSSDDEITFVKYLGNGMFMDLVSDQLLTVNAYNCDDFGGAQYSDLDKESQKEMDKMQECWWSIRQAGNKTEFVDNFSMFIQNPLAINFEAAPFMSINAEVAEKFASQSLEQLSTKMMIAKTYAQQRLAKQYAQYEKKIDEYFSAVEIESTNKKLQ